LHPEKIRRNGSKKSILVITKPPENLDFEEPYFFVEHALFFYSFWVFGFFKTTVITTNNKAHIAFIKVDFNYTLYSRTGKGKQAKRCLLSHFPLLWRYIQG
jgi:hypothetical protein